MKLLGTVATILDITSTSTATATRPAPSNVRIKGVSVLGSGCPAGTANVQVDATGTLFRGHLFDLQCIGAEIASFTLNMEFDEDYHFSVLDTNMIGFAEIPKGAQGKMHEYLFPLLELAEGTSNIQ
ncbi:hypothetical protein NHJ13051_003089 [Beauveria bassiana]